MTSIADMTALILCGGMGTRLREETEFKPKPMVTIGGKPIIWHIMRHYRQFGVRNFVLCLGYKGDIIRDFFVNYPLYKSDFTVDLNTGSVQTRSNGDVEDWRVTLAETGAETLTGARIKKALRYCESETFFATYGDGVSDIDLTRLFAHHRSAGRLATVSAVRPSSRFGELSIQDGLVSKFREKPQVAEGWINGGFFVFEKRAFDGISPAENVALEEGVLESLAGDSDLAVYQHHGFWQSMDTYREMQLLNELWDAGDAPWHIEEECKLSA